MLRQTDLTMDRQSVEVSTKNLDLPEKLSTRVTGVSTIVSPEKKPLFPNIADCRLRKGAI